MMVVIASLALLPFVGLAVRATAWLIGERAYTSLLVVAVVLAWFWYPVSLAFR